MKDRIAFPTENTHVHRPRRPVREAPEAVIARAKKRKDALSKRKPIAAVRKQVAALAKAQGYTIAEKAVRRRRCGHAGSGAGEARGAQVDQGPHAGQGRAEIPQPREPEGNLERPRHAAALAGRTGAPRQVRRRFPDQRQVYSLPPKPGRRVVKAAEA